MFKAVIWATITILLIGLYSIPEFQKYWWRWLGLLGFFLIGWFYNQAFK